MRLVVVCSLGFLGVESLIPAVPASKQIIGGRRLGHVEGDAGVAGTTSTTRRFSSKRATEPDSLPEP